MSYVAGVHYVCARYDPPGNMGGSFEANLLPTSTSLSSSCSSNNAQDENMEKEKANEKKHREKVEDEKLTEKFKYGKTFFQSNIILFIFRIF